MQSDTEHQRLTKIILTCAAVGCTGVFYAFLLVPNGVSVPCVFHLITGLNCPGCGISRMCLALLHGDVRAAVACNYGLALAIPFLAVLLFRSALRYIRRDGQGMTSWERWLCRAILVWLALWMIYRNWRGI